LSLFKGEDEERILLSDQIVILIKVSSNISNNQFSGVASDGSRKLGGNSSRSEGLCGLGGGRISLSGAGSKRLRRFNCFSQFELDFNPSDFVLLLGGVVKLDNIRSSRERLDLGEFVDDFSDQIV